MTNILPDFWLINIVSRKMIFPVDYKMLPKVSRFLRLAVFLPATIIPLLMPAQQPGDSTANTLKILFIGDIMGHDTQIAAALDDSTGIYDYRSVFRYISPVIQSHDIAIANLEVTLAGPPYKGYPLFSSPAPLASAAKEAGINFMVTANNHSVDRGLSGLRNTIFRLDSLGIAHTGTYLTADDRDSLVPAIINEKGYRIAILNYTYGTNGISVPLPAVVDLTDKELMATDLAKTRGADIDGIIVFIHWGTEYDTIQGKNQTELADWLIENGANMVIGSHPHVLQPMILETSEGDAGDKLVVYSLGNFISNQRKRRTDGGAMVSVTIEKGETGLRITEAEYILTWVYTPTENDRRRFYILPAAAHEGDQEIPADKESKELMKLFIDDSRRLLGNHNRGVTEKK
jgi:poly-gamma-glutamate capsule biosynthesis protein CapA/YwtB (metallophosphatase superfamily)